MSCVTHTHPTLNYQSVDIILLVLFVLSLLSIINESVQTASVTRKVDSFHNWCNSSFAFVIKNKTKQIDQVKGKKVFNFVKNDQLYFFIKHSCSHVVCNVKSYFLLFFNLILKSNKHSFVWNFQGNTFQLFKNLFTHIFIICFLNSNKVCFNNFFI